MFRYKIRRFFRLYKTAIFAVIVTLAVLSGFLVSSINQPTIRVNAQQQSPSSNAAAPSPSWHKAP